MSLFSTKFSDQIKKKKCNSLWGELTIHHELRTYDAVACSECKEDSIAPYTWEGRNFYSDLSLTKFISVNFVGLLFKSFISVPILFVLATCHVECQTEAEVNSVEEPGGEDIQTAEVRLCSCSTNNVFPLFHVFFLSKLQLCFKIE